MKEKILNAFYQKIVPGTSKEEPVYIGEWPFFVDFSIDVIGDLSRTDNNSIVLEIKDKESFDKALVEYSTCMIDHLNNYKKLQDMESIYYNGNINEIIESVVLNVWFNATEEDFKNPIQFLNTRKNFLIDSFSINNLEKIYKSDNIVELDNNHIETTIDIQNPSGYETPFVYKSKICNDFGDEFELPNISYGISDGKCYIYSIQGKSKKEKSSYDKKINRLLYKANEDLMYEYESESIKDVSMAPLYALTTFFKMLEENNIKDVIVKNYYPVRYYNKEAVIKRKINKLEQQKPNIDSDEYTKWKENIEKLSTMNDFIQNNINNKYLRNFRRLEYQFSNIDITSFPYELDNNMHIKLSEYKDFYNTHILNKVYENMSFSRNIQK